MDRFRGRCRQWLGFVGDFLKWADYHAASIPAILGEPARRNISSNKPACSSQNHQHQLPHPIAASIISISSSTPLRAGPTQPASSAPPPNSSQHHQHQFLHLFTNRPHAASIISISSPTQALCEPTFSSQHHKAPGSKHHQHQFLHPFTSRPHTASISSPTQ